MIRNAESPTFQYLLPALGILIVILIIWNVIVRLNQAARMRRGDLKVIDQKRQSNKRNSNRLVMSIGRAGKRHSIFALIHHAGRKSGKIYTTPVRCVRNGSTFTIPLTYGTRADWYQNLQASGSMELTWQGQTYQVGEPEWLEVSETTDEFPGISRFLFRLDGLPAFIRVRVIS